MIEAAARPPSSAPGVPASEATGYTHREVIIIYIGLLLGMMLGALDQTIVATALPTIVGEFGGLNHLSWVVTGYLLTSTASTLLYGKLGDLIGRKRMFQVAIVIFLLGSALSGLSQSMAQLIAFRAVQGLGAGGLMALAMAIIGDIVAPRERGRYQGYNGAVFGLASIGGPLLGGFFVDTLSWRWVFYINLPLGIGALILTSLWLRETTRRKHSQIDYAGAALMVGGVTSLLLVSTWAGSQYAWSSPQILGLLGAAVVLLTLFVLVERTAPEPILSLELFRNGVFNIGNVGSFAMGAAMLGSVVFLPLFLQLVTGASATNSGLLLMPLMLGAITASILAGRFVSATGRYKFFPVTGLSLELIAFLLLSTMTATTPQPMAAAYMVMLGIGMGMTMQVLTTAVQNAVDRRHLGTATSAMQFFRSMGGALGVAVYGSILNNRLAYYLSQLLPPGATPQGFSPADISGGPAEILSLPPAVRQAIIESFARALHVVFLASVPMVAIALIAALFLEERPLRSTSHLEAEGHSALAA